MSEWIKCNDRLPDCPHECTTDHTMVSRSLLLTNIHDLGSLAMGHMRKDGSWKLYGGDYDFMDLEVVTHWQLFPAPPKP